MSHERHLQDVERLEMRIQAELQLYEASEDVAATTNMGISELEQYQLGQENPRQNMDRIHLLQEVLLWIEHLRQDILSTESEELGFDPLQRLETRMLQNFQSDDLITSEVLQKMNIWIQEIRNRPQ